MHTTRLAACVVMCLAAVSAAQTPKPKAVLKGPTDGVTSLAFSPDGKMLAVAGNDSKVSVFGLPTGKERLTLEGVMGRGRKVVFSPDGKAVAFRESTFTPTR